MKTSRIPSPARSQGQARTPRREKPRRSRSVASPATSNNSGRLTAVIEGYKDKNESFALALMGGRRSILTDNTDIADEPRRKSWWRNLNENSRDVMEVLEDNNLVEPNNIMEELDIEVLSQEKKTYTVDMPDSSGSESINSIVMPQRKLFTQKETQHQKKFSQIMGKRDTLTKTNKNDTAADQIINAGTKELFQNKQRSKPMFPAALLAMSPDKTIGDKTKEFVAEPKTQVRNIFGNRAGAKRKNMFANFIVSESEDEIPDIQPKVFEFPKKIDQKRRGSSQSRGIRESSPGSVTTDIEMDDWKHLPSSTMVENQLEAMFEGTTPVKRPRLSKLSETKESETNTSNQSKQTNKSAVKNTSVRTRSRSRIILEENEIETAQENPYESQDQDQQNLIINKTKENSNKCELKNKSKNTSKINQSNKSTSKLASALSKSKSTNDLNEKNATVTHDMQLDAENISENLEEQNPEPIEDELNETSKEVNVSQKTVDGSNTEENDAEEPSENQSQLDETQEEGNENEEVEESEEIEASVQEESKNEESIDESQEFIDGVQEEINETSEEAIENSENEKLVDENQEKVDKRHKKADQSQVQGNPSQEEVVNSRKKADRSRQVDKTQVKTRETREKDDSSQEEVNQAQEDIDPNNEEVSNSQEADQSEEIVDQNAEIVDQGQERDESGEANDDQEEECASEIEAGQSNAVEESQEVEEEDVNESEEVEQSHEVQEEEADESEEVEQSQEAEEKEADDTEEVEQSQEVEEEEADESGEVEQSQEVDDNHNKSDNEIQNKTQETENESEQDSENDAEESAGLHYESEEMEVDNEEAQNDNYQQNEETNHSKKEQEQILEDDSPNITHDTTGRNRKKNESPDAIRHDKTNHNISFSRGRNTSIRRTSMIKSLNIRPSAAPQRDSVGFSDGTTNSSAEGSGWDSHRTTRKTIRQTFGKDATPSRKSLRTLVMEKSAKRQTLANKDIASDTAKFPLANSTELPEVSNNHMDFDDHQESVHELSLRTRQTTLEAFLQKIKMHSLERRAKIEEAVRNSLETHAENPFKVPQRPLFPRRPLKTLNKPKKQSNLQNIPEELIEDLQYKPPKRFRPANAAWITNRLYKYLESKLEPKYDYKARVRSEKLIETIYQFTKELRRQKVVSADAVDVLKHEMARLDIVKTHYDFYEFFHQFMPREIRVKVVPDVVNKIPLPRRGVFTDILIPRPSQA